MEDTAIQRVLEESIADSGYVNTFILCFWCVGGKIAHLFMMRYVFNVLHLLSRISPFLNPDNHMRCIE